MTAAAIAARARPFQCELIDEAFSAQVLAELAGEVSRSVPFEVWNKALYGPLDDFVSRPGKELRARLVRHAWSLSGGSGEPPEELPAMVELLHAGSLIVDDIEDEATRRRGELALHCLHGLPIALNAGNWLYFLPFTLVGRISASPESQLEIFRATSRCLLACHYGQALDLGARMSTIAQKDVFSVVATTTRLKTASLTELAATLGAIAAGAGPFVSRLLARFGHELGIGLQMLDDLGSITSDRLCHKGHEDLIGGRPTWPWAWLSEDVDAASYATLQQLARAVESRDAHPELLVERMRSDLDEPGRARVHAHLDRSVAELESAFAGAPALAGIREDIATMERSYE